VGKTETFPSKVKKKTFSPLNILLEFLAKTIKYEEEIKEYK
jgi:hypothetical protein